MSTDKRSGRTTVKVCKYRGFSFLEILIALLCLSFATLSLTKLQVYVEKSTELAADRLQALHLVEDKLEWFRTRGASSEYSSMTPAGFSQDLVSSEEQVSDKYLMSWTSESAGLSESLKRVTVAVSWVDRFGQPQEVSLNTLIAQSSEFD
ncbi:type IV pilus modification PilV family protein [Vibrio marisflavi]|uniref:Type IV pilin n=1 Tax=Vibrio marisflavi CECT 7928 TaxID=634439 RepID=A0ABN8E534_9VIBR|nr:type IV pilin [Vibrio marisflavi]CAH0538870.1 hypothetical protein VMF7928_01730 [Vibrio marisflavi CECT 7928]